MSTVEEEETDVLESLFGREEDTVDEQIIIKYDEYHRIFGQFEGKDRSQPEVLQLALVKKHHSLWAEFVYNAARVVSDKIDQSIITCSGRTCLELGAGAGLPGLLASLNGATVSVISDYGTEADKSLLRAIELNIASVVEVVKSSHGNELVMACVPYVWGNCVDPLILPLQHLGSSRKFDVIILADLIFNRSEHRKLLWTVQQCLEPNDGIAWVSFSHHDPHKKHLDLNFFTLAVEEFGLIVESVCEESRKAYPFVEEDGRDDARGMVYLYTLRLP